jgi:hypothetical protein
MSFVAEPVHADCCCGFDEIQTEGRTITVQARCDACPHHGYPHRRQVQPRRMTEPSGNGRLPWASIGPTYARK